MIIKLLYERFFLALMFGAYRSLQIKCVLSPLFIAVYLNDKKASSKIATIIKSSISISTDLFVKKSNANETMEECKQYTALTYH